MAKSARASAVKKNKSKLKSKVFGPVEQARAERLSQKLLQLAQQAKPREAAKMAVGDVEVEEGGNDEVEGVSTSCYFPSSPIGSGWRNLTAI